MGAGFSGGSAMPPWFLRHMKQRLHSSVPSPRLRHCRCSTLPQCEQHLPQPSLHDDAPREALLNAAAAAAAALLREPASGLFGKEGLPGMLSRWLRWLPAVAIAAAAVVLMAEPAKIGRGAVCSMWVLKSVLRGLRPGCWFCCCWCCWCCTIMLERWLKKAGSAAAAAKLLQSEGLAAGRCGAGTAAFIRGSAAASPATAATALLQGVEECCAAVPAAVDGAGAAEVPAARSQLVRWGKLCC
jgi:hypothetical protein